MQAENSMRNLQATLNQSDREDHLQRQREVQRPDSRVLQQAAMQVVNGKENLNETNVHSDFYQQARTFDPPTNYDQWDQYNLQPRQPAQPKKPLSLAARAQAKERESSRENNYRKVFVPQQQHHEIVYPNRTQEVRSMVQPQHPYGSQLAQTKQLDKLQKRQQLLAHFDDIPIHQLHKADGYQIRNIEEEYPAPKMGSSLPEDASSLPLRDQAFHSQWKVRMQAYKGIAQEFLQFQAGARQRSREEEMYGDPESPFSVYAPLMEQIIKDSNLIAQFEGLSCLLTFVQLSEDIKSVTFATH
jgi:hypothetical protein